ncbi:hypothetical protein MA16_Dca012340 [Dendrobium catenatum]|uniref:Uncharacterized protein n=1 Tax=Dendrobium catenatum TaxID=906689 RepID=A0A2I0VHZ2_9ASPA|nr:hypothetical protein MA16_Dca012340 [Dendrobium catenatum]
MKLHLPSYDPPIAAPSHIHIRLQRIWLPWFSPQELHIHLIMEPRMCFIVRKLSKRKIHSL